MSQFLFEVSYTSSSWASQVRQQGNVIERIQPLIDGCGGTVTACYYALGEHDLVLIAEFPGNQEAAAFSLAATAGGSVKSIRTVPLLTIDQGIAAMSRAAEIGLNYRPVVGAVPAQAT